VRVCSLLLLSKIASHDNHVISGRRLSVADYGAPVEKNFPSVRVGSFSSSKLSFSVI
jgi:hypothetical protein